MRLIRGTRALHHAGATDPQDFNGIGSACIENRTVRFRLYRR
jgi:hypothetical protein